MTMIDADTTDIAGVTGLTGVRSGEGGRAAAPLPPGPGGPDAAALLDRAHAAVAPRLRADLTALPAPLRRVAMYHFGWERADGTPVAGAGGRAPRGPAPRPAARPPPGGRGPGARA
ncbi:polyprenyl synthetase family protein, partial [Streptomyces fradiae]